MTEQELRDHGLEIMHGDYTGTTDDRVDRWYLQSVDGPIDHRGQGYPSKQYILDHAVLNHGVVVIRD